METVLEGSEKKYFNVTSSGLGNCILQCVSKSGVMIGEGRFTVVCKDKEVVKTLIDKIKGFKGYLNHSEEFITRKEFKTKQEKLISEFNIDDFTYLFIPQNYN